MGCLEKNCQHAEYENIIDYCQQNSIKLTPLRGQVLKIIAASDKPLTAYAVLDLLRKVKPKSQVMSVYRILNFLLEHGLIHRIESLNAFILCHHRSNQEHLSQWLICEQCGHVTEYDLPVFQTGLEMLSKKAGFNVTASVIELSGICADCQRVTS